MFFRFNKDPRFEGFGSTAKIKLHNDSVPLFLNEFPTDADQLSSIDLSDVALIKIISHPFQGRELGGIAIYLRNGSEITRDSRPIDKFPSLKYRSLEGYDKNEDFPNVNYNFASKVQAFQDKRLTLYWNPNLQSEKKKSGEIKFYNNDLAKSFNISVLGYDKENEQYIYLNENVTP